MSDASVDGSAASILWERTAEGERTQRMRRFEGLGFEGAD
jgi:hypothetical protein